LGLRMSRRIGNHRIRFDPATDIGMQLLAIGRFEPDAIAQCAKHIRPQSVVLDIGANIGVHTVQFATFASAGKVVCLEPARSTFDYLLRNVRDLQNVVPMNVALSDSTSLQTFFVAADNAFSGLKDTRRKRIVRQESVACYRADELLLPLLAGHKIDLVKI